MAGPFPVSMLVSVMDDANAFRGAVKQPVLVWEAPPQAKEDPLLFATRSGAPMQRPRAGTPVYFAVAKSVKNAFADEVTVGRTLNNDICLEDNSISRFHAYLKPSTTGWSLVDKSTNGSWVAGQRAEPKMPLDVQDGARVRLGDVELLFFEIDSFREYVRKLSASRPR